ncbi:hypothetical protein EVAR_48717_1 [Eumeta japonica]|uniref:Histone-lysine N-methyltransferase SETMAR n=1 Tax=Eumeta variegata TaxID=151549 RepID=A0A4C1XD80_EUMVA|nr:hypothetical protein EVAR_48717_1 [Eumeta japonica]
MVKKWFTEFRCGRTGTSHAERSGRPKEVVTSDLIDKIHRIHRTLDNWRMKVRKVTETVSISTERVQHIIHGFLEMKKLSVEWVPLSLALNLKRNHVITSKECLAMFSRTQRYNPENEFLRVNMHQRRPRRVCRPTRSRRSFLRCTWYHSHRLR